MKKLIVLLCLMTTSAFAEGKQAHEFDRSFNNQMIKECLDVWGYDKYAPVETRLNNFNWQGAAGCVANFRLEEQRKQVEADREFLKEKPWFRGSNWKWQEKAEYTCTKQLHNGGITVCHKPFYIN